MERYVFVRGKIREDNIICSLTKVFKDKVKRIRAFTLAETLIVMGVIGIVAALTIPNLNSCYK